METLMTHLRKMMTLTMKSVLGERAKNPRIKIAPLADLVLQPRKARINPYLLFESLPSLLFESLPSI